VKGNKVSLVGTVLLRQCCPTGRNAHVTDAMPDRRVLGRQKCDWILLWGTEAENGWIEAEADGIEASEVRGGEIHVKTMG
jgi:hypothetical protein